MLERIEQFYFIFTLAQFNWEPCGYENCFYDAAVNGAALLSAAEGKTPREMLIYTDVKKKEKAELIIRPWAYQAVMWSVCWCCKASHKKACVCPGGPNTYWIGLCSGSDHHIVPSGRHSLVSVFRAKAKYDGPTVRCTWLLVLAPPPPTAVVNQELMKGNSQHKCHRVHTSISSSFRGQDDILISQPSEGSSLISGAASFHFCCRFVGHKSVLHIDSFFFFFFSLIQTIRHAKAHFFH